MVLVRKRKPLHLEVQGLLWECLIQVTYELQGHIPHVICLLNSSIHLKAWFPPTSPHQVYLIPFTSFKNNYISNYRAYLSDLEIKEELLFSMTSCELDWFNFLEKKTRGMIKEQLWICGRGQSLGIEPFLLLNLKNSHFSSGYLCEATAFQVFLPRS